MESMLHLPLVNIIFHLNFEKKTVFCDWVTLNQAVYDELGVERGGLRAISQDRNNLIFRELETSFKPGFLTMSAKDKGALDIHKRTFKEEKRRYCIVAFALKTFSDDIQNWKPAHSAIAYMRDRDGAKKTKSDSLTQLINDLIKVYVLDSLTMTMSLVLS